MDQCQLCQSNGAQPCRGCAFGIPICEPCLATVEGWRCELCAAAKADGMLLVRRLLLHVFAMRAELLQDDLADASYDDGEPAWD